MVLTGDSESKEEILKEIDLLDSKYHIRKHVGGRLYYPDGPETPPSIDATYLYYYDRKKFNSLCNEVEEFVEMMNNKGKYVKLSYESE